MSNYSLFTFPMSDLILIPVLHLPFLIYFLSSARVNDLS